MMSIVENLMRLFGVSAVRYFVIAGVPFILFYKLLSNWFSQSKIQNRNAGIKDFVREILHSMQSTAVFAVIGYLVLFTPLQNYTQVYTDINAYPVWWIAISLILSLIIHDTYFYWMHRLLHHKKLFR